MLAENRISASQAERDELDWLLRSRGISRSTNLARALRFICEEHFAGRGGDIREYTIAVQALGRKQNFDPQTDTIVRVTVHALRKRLEDIYEGEGADRPLKILIPLGKYIPLFVPRTRARFPEVVESAVLETESGVDTPEDPSRGDSSSSLVEPVDDEDVSNVARARATTTKLKPRLAALSSLVLIAVVFCVFLFRYHRVSGLDGSLKSAASSPQVGPFSEVHALLGGSRAPYTDHAGQVWATTSVCDGGNAVPRPATEIEGTEDPALYAGGVRGIVRCVFPVKPGLYELHFLFSESSKLSIATRVAQISVNAGPYSSFDVVDEAGGTGRATTMVISKVAPENDGTVHVDYISEVSPLNAIEIVPIGSGSLLPIRIVAGSSPVIDAAGILWLPDRYFVGGRRGQPFAQASGKTTIYDSDRVGRFSYRIPVVAQEHYRVRLFFKDPWFGPGNGGKGGPGSRIFDVSCNGLPLLRNFDILAEGNGQPVVKTFDDVQASHAGRLELAFLPEVNYPIVNAIEVTPLD